MIEINLLPGKKKRAAPGGGFKLALPDFRGLIASVKNPWLIAASGPSGPVNAPPGAPDTGAAPAVRVWITGKTVDIQAYTTFLRQLAASPWLTDVSPATSSTVIDADRPVTAFNVSLRYKVADSVYIRTIPLTQSVR